MSLSWSLRRFLASAFTDVLLWGVWIIVISGSLVLPIYLGISFLSARNCHPHKEISFPPGSLPTPSFGQIPGNETKEEKTLLELFLPAEIKLELGGVNVSIPVLPLHLFQSGSVLLESLLSRYNIAEISSYCEVNGIRAPGVISLGVGVCREALADRMGDAQTQNLQTWLTGIPEGVETNIVGDVLAGNLSRVVQQIPKMFSTGDLTDTQVSALTSLIEPLSTDELSNLLEAVNSVNLTNKDFAVLQEVAKTSGDDLKAAEKVLKKINVTNLPLIMEKLGVLEIQLTDFITNPGIFFEFLGDPEKSAILVDLQTLLPRFKPADIETFLKLQQNVDDAQLKLGDPDKPVMAKLFAIPMDALMSALPKLKSLSERFSFLLDPEIQTKILQDCTNQTLDVSCRDEINDVCPYGHFFLGLASLAPLLIPGLLYSITTFLHYKGDIMQCGLGKPFNMPSSKLDRVSAWIILLPLYFLFMVPWTLFLIVFRQVLVWLSLIEETSGGSRVESDCESIKDASSFGLLAGAGQGVLHLGLQVVIVALLVGAGDILFGLDHMTIETNVGVAIASALLSSIVLAVSYLSGQECGRLSQDLSTPASSTSYIFSSLSWLGFATFVSVLSSVVLSLLLYVDTAAFSTSSWTIVPIVLLIGQPLIQCIAYQNLVRESSEHRFGWGVMATAIPVRFLDIDKKRAYRFLLVSQGIWLLCHIAAWVAYSLYALFTDSSDVVFRVWIPIIIPLLLVPPLLAGLHWAVSLAPLYSSKHAHPDMADLNRRVSSFPPDWRDLSQTSIASENLAQAGFFYSCRRLTSGEATCFSCGRQVTDWSTGKTAAQAHKLAADYCPFYSDDKEIASLDDSPSKNTVSCFSEFFFISATLVFRIGSFCLLLWVFMEQWVHVSPSLSTILIIPPLYIFLLILLNCCSYYLCLGAHARPLWAFLSVLLPRPLKSSLSSARKLLVINVACNSLVHAFLWAAMIGACSQCSLILSLSELSTAWPALLVFGLISILAAVPYYLFTVRLSRPVTNKVQNGTSYVVSTAL